MTDQWPPTLTADDIHSRRDLSARRIPWPFVQILGIHPTGHRIRFTLSMTSDYLDHLAFTAEIFDASTPVWNHLWTIPGSAYKYRGGVDEPEPALDPGTNILERALHQRPQRQAASWQKIVNALAAKADEILTAEPLPNLR
ncbi:hypothetical protein [Nocardia sp. CA-120079]|uniref:hypothetical protein n=1 Tax=Nocardia sp. CA-120079 TaxID=3239974 RepID=UPI003D96B7E6